VVRRLAYTAGVDPIRPSRPPVLRAALLALTLSLTTPILLVACRPPAERTDASRPVEVTLLTTPARVGPAAIEVRLSVDGAPVDGASVRVVGDMTHAGMVPVVADAVGLGGGIYRTEGFAFDMAGDWVITADVRYPDAVTRQGSLAVAVTR
jgi:hypothetical protein